MPDAECRIPTTGMLWADGGPPVDVLGSAAGTLLSETDEASRPARRLGVAARRPEAHAVWMLCSERYGGGGGGEGAS